MSALAKSAGTNTGNEAYRILVVDDDEMNRDMLSRRLARRGYDTLVAEDGQQALDVINEEPVDLVMLDIMMPGMSGVEVLRILRQTYGEDELPVIMATAKSDSKDVVESLDLGANDYVTKPLDFPIVLARVKAQLRDKIPASDRARFQAGGGQPAPTSQVIGKYRIEGEIGAGNCGTVYRGEHQALQRPVAIKVLHGAIQGDTETLIRFRQEGISACRVRHPNAVEVMDIGVQPNGAAYLVMELLEGHSLAEEMKATGPMSPVRCAEILWPICEALAEAHRKGIIHRDVKPANIFLHRTSHGEVVKVLDFGIAKLVGDASLDQSLTMTGSLIGTPAYLAPERIRGDDYDGRTDVYSLAVTLYQMLTGRLPVGDVSLGPVALAMKHVQEDPRPIRWYRPDLPTTVESIVMQALDKRVEQRPTADQLGQEFVMALGLPLPQAGRPQWPQWPSQPAAPPVPASVLGRLPTPDERPPERRSDLSDPRPGPPKLHHRTVLPAAAPLGDAAARPDVVPAQRIDIADAPTVDLGPPADRED